MRPITDELALVREDWALSPFTGWTRSHVERVVELACAAVRPYASPHHSLITLPGPNSHSGPHSDQLEAFARTFVGAGLYLAGSDADPSGLAEWYAEGLRAGPDPSSPDAWPSLVDIRQARVEAGALAIALSESRRQVWDRLDSSSQDRLVAWLAPTTHIGYPPNNWLLFQSLVQAFLASVGADHDPDVMATNLEVLETYYLGDGLYTDGGMAKRDRDLDWYNSWVIHSFFVWYVRALGDQAPPGLADQVRERLSAYLDTMLLLIGSDGAPLVQGRSLTYRFGMAVAPWCGAVIGTTQPPGQLRRAANGIIKHFVDHGAFDEHHLLPIGWWGEYEPMRQPYSGPGSPYWSMHGVSGLVLPASHPVWADAEVGLPIDGGDVEATVPHVGWAVDGLAGDGIIRVRNHGVDHARGEAKPENPLYARFAYSTVTHPMRGEMSADGIGDNQVLLRRAGETSLRVPIVRRTAAAGAVGSSFTAFPESSQPVAVDVVSVAHGVTEVRFVRVTEAGVDLVVSGYPTGARHTSPVTGVGSGWEQGRSSALEPQVFGNVSVEWVRGESTGSWQAVIVGLAPAASAVVSPTVEVEAEHGRVRWPDGHEWSGDLALTPQS